MALELEDEKHEIAEESYKTKRAREKLRKQLEKEEAFVTPQALERTMIEIHRWIARRAPERVVLKSKTISLFDENQTPAKVSRRIEAFANKFGCPLETATPLSKRIIKKTN